MKRTEDMNGKKETEKMIEKENTHGKSSYVI